MCIMTGKNIARRHQLHHVGVWGAHTFAVAGSSVASPPLAAAGDELRWHRGGGKAALLHGEDAWVLAMT